MKQHRPWRFAACLVTLGCLLPLAGQTAAAPLPVDAQTLQKLRLHSVPPVYPPAEKMAGQPGDVTLRVVLGADGSVQSVTPVQATSADFAAAALASVEQWTYKAYVLNGRAMSVEGEVQLHFRISR